MPSLSDVEWIYVVLAVLYVSELVLWARPGAIAFISSWGSFGSTCSSRRLTGNEQGNLMLGGLAPFDVSLVLESWPISITDQGVVGFVATAPLLPERPDQSGRVFTWDQLATTTSSERNVLVDGDVLCRVSSAMRAADLAGRLKRLAQCSEASGDETSGDTVTDNEVSRSTAIEQWRAERFDVALGTERWNAWQEATLAVRIVATVLFLWICPVGLMLHYGWLPLASDQWVNIAYLVVLFSLWWFTAIVAWMAHRYLYPLQRAERWKLLAYSLLSPAVPLRLADQLGRNLLIWTHPLVVSQVVDSKAKFRSVAERIVRDATYPRLPLTPPESSPLGDEIVRASAAADYEHLVRLVVSQQLVIEELLAPPTFEDDQTASYCPRCLHEFAIDSANCEACGGRLAVPLHP